MNRSRSARLATLLVAAGSALVACGGGDGLSDAAADDLSARVAQVRAAAASGNRAAAGSALADLRGAVATRRSQGQVSEERGAEILSAAADVESHLGLLPAPVTPTTSPPRQRQSTTTAPADEGKDEGKDGGPGRDKKKEDGDGD